MTFDEIKTLGGRRLPAHLTLTPTDVEGQRTEMRYLEVQFDVADPGRHVQPVAPRAGQVIVRVPVPTTWRIAWRNLWRNPRRTALALAAIGLSVTLVLALRRHPALGRRLDGRHDHRADARPRAGARARLAPDARDGQDAAATSRASSTRCAAIRTSPASTRASTRRRWRRSARRASPSSSSAWTSRRRRARRGCSPA